MKSVMYGSSFGTCLLLTVILTVLVLIFSSELGNAGLVSRYVL